MKKKIFVLIGICLSISCLLLAGCNSSKQKQAKEISILYPNWAEGVALTQLTKAALEDMGYDVKITPLEPGPIYASIAKGDADLCVDAWLPHTHKSYWQRYGDKLDILGRSFTNGTTGLVVPSYVEIASITELNDHKDKFDQKIIGIGSGAGIHTNTDKAIKEYELDFKQVTSSGPAMMASLAKAYNKKAPVLITGWKPHYMWAKFDLKYLKDPKGIYPKDACTVIARKGFKKDFPKLAKFFDNFKLSEKQLYDLINTIKNSNGEEKAAQTWYNQNKKMIKNWLPAK